MTDKTRVTSASSKPLAKMRKKPPKNLHKMVELIDRQTVFQFGYLILSSMVQSPKVSIEVEGDDRARALAENLTQRWRESLPEAMEAFKYGRSCFEKTYEWNPQTQLQELRKLRSLPYEYTTLTMDGEGCFAGLRFTAKHAADSFELTAQQVWWFALDPDALHPEGRTRYRGAVLEVWSDLDRLDCNEDVWLHRFALGQGVASAPSEYPDNPITGEGNVDQQNSDSTPKDPIEDLRQAILDCESGGVVVIRSDKDDKGSPLFTYDALKQQPDATALFTKRTQLEERALMALGIAPRSVMQAPDAVGSYGMAETHKDVTTHTAEVILEQLKTSFQKYVIDKAVELNCPGAKLKLTSQPIDPRWRALVLNLVTQVLSGNALSPLIANLVIDVPKLLEISGVPVGDQVLQKLEAVRLQLEKSMQPQLPTLPGMPIQFSTIKDDPPPILPSWEELADSAIKDAREVASKINDIPQTADAGRLLRQDT